jgi:hypothetical protein
VIRIAVAAVAASLVLTACSGGHGELEVEAPAGAGSPAVALAPPVDHVHGAVVVDGALLLGTHTGLVEADPTSGRTERRGSSLDDFMGLAAHGQTLYGSGHPGEGSTLPDPLGLIRSDDGGQSWTPVSLTGEVDFHGLAAEGDLVAGIGTADGPILSEDGGRTWRSLDIPGATALAWFQGELWFATETGLLLADGTGAPSPASQEGTVALATADDGTALWAVTGDGGVWRTTDGTTWHQHGVITALEALAATATEAYAVTADQVTVIGADDAMSADEK